MEGGGRGHGGRGAHFRGGGHILFWGHIWGRRSHSIFGSRLGEEITLSLWVTSGGGDQILSLTCRDGCTCCCIVWWLLSRSAKSFKLQSTVITLANIACQLHCQCPLQGRRSKVRDNVTTLHHGTMSQSRIFRFSDPMQFKPWTYLHIGP